MRTSDTKDKVDNLDGDALEAFLNTLADEEVETLVGLVASLDRLEIKDGAPRFDEAEMDLIGRFDDLVNGRS